MESLFAHINRFIPFSEAEFHEIQSYFELTTLNKKEILIAAGSKCNTNHFVLEGCLHMYFISEKGVNQTVQFAIENWWITDTLAFHKQITTEFYIQAIEKSQLLSISHENQELLLRKFPALERYFRIIYQISFGATMNKMKYIHEFSKEEMYFHFTELFPEFEQRVPQYLIASYLGLTPEYVSEIRNKKRS